MQQIINEGYEKGLTKTLTHIKLTLSQMFQQAIINDILIKNPCIGINIPTYQKKQKRALCREEIEIIKNLELDPKLKAYVFILLYTGIRRGEALALTKDDIDFDNNKININKTVIFKENASEIKHNTKTKAGIRTIPILEPLRHFLADYLSSIETHNLFTTQTGDIITRSSFRRMWYKFVVAMEDVINKDESDNDDRLECDITPHTFRHNFATTLYYAGVDIKSAQAILGHSSISVTMDIYTHLDKEKNEETVNKLNNYLS